MSSRNVSEATLHKQAVRVIEGPHPIERGYEEMAAFVEEALEAFGQDFRYAESMARDAGKVRKTRPRRSRSRSVDSP